MATRIKFDIMQNCQAIFKEDQCLIWDVGEMVRGSSFFEEGHFNPIPVRSESLHLKENSKNKFMISHKYLLNQQ